MLGWCVRIRGVCVSVECPGSWGYVVYVCVGRCLGVASVNVCLGGVCTCVWVWYVVCVGGLFGGVRVCVSHAVGSLSL